MLHIVYSPHFFHDHIVFLLALHILLFNRNPKMTTVVTYNQLNLFVALVTLGENT